MYIRGGTRWVGTKCIPVPNPIRVFKIFSYPTYTRLLSFTPVPIGAGRVTRLAQKIVIPNHTWSTHNIIHSNCIVPSHQFFFFFFNFFCHLSRHCWNNIKKTKYFFKYIFYFRNQICIVFKHGKFLPFVSEISLKKLFYFNIFLSF